MIKSDWLSKRKFLVGRIFFTKLNSAVTRELKIKKDYQVSTNLVGDGLMRKLNKQWRQQNRPTDVLAWPFAEGERVIVNGRVEYLGEIVIDYQQAERQAREHNYSLRAELARLYVHGLLHLLGFDHNTPSKLKKMKILEDKILKKAKVAL